MDILRGSGSSFSTSGNRWRPFRTDPKVAARIRRLKRLEAKGFLLKQSKAQARIELDRLIAEHKSKA